MPRAKDKPSYRRVRVDFWHHAKTGDLPPLLKLIVLCLATWDHPACIVYATPRRVLSAVSPGFSEAEVIAALETLSGQGVIWWDKIRDIIWLVEGLDEQGFTGSSNDASVRYHLESFEDCDLVRAFGLKYPQGVQHSAKRKSDRVSGEGVAHPVSSLRVPSPAPVSSPSTATATSAENGASGAQPSSPSPQPDILNTSDVVAVSPCVPDSPGAMSPSQSSQEPPQAVGPQGGSSVAPSGENGTRAGSGALSPLGGLRAELDARRKELADRAAALLIDDGPRPRPATPEDKLSAVAQGLRHELDAMRRQVMADTGAHLSPLSRKGSETVDGITAALEDHEPAEIVEIARWRAEQVAAGKSAQVLWVCLFHGNGFSLTVRERLEAKDGGHRWRPRADVEAELRADAERYGWEPEKLEAELEDVRKFCDERGIA